MHHLGVVVVDLPAGKASERLSQGYLPLEPGQSGTDAEVRPVAEGKLPVDVASHVEPVGVGEMTFVAIGAAIEQEKLGVLGHDLTVELDILSDPPAVHRRGRFEAKAFLNGIRDEARLGEEELRGLREDKLASIRSHAKFLAELDTVA